MTLLSPAIRVEPGLLRAVRYALPLAVMDVGSEAAAWLHADVQRTPVAFAYQHETINTYRELFREFVKNNPALSQTIGELVAQYHVHLSPVIALEEAWIRAELTESELSAAEQDKLWQIAKTLATPNSPFLAQFLAWLGRLTSRQHAAVWEKIKGLAEAWAWANREAYQQSRVEIPIGLNVSDVAWVLVEHVNEPPQRWVLYQQGTDLILDTEIDFEQGSYFATVSMAVLSWQVQLINQTAQTQDSIHYFEPVKAGSTLVLPDSDNQLWIKTDHTELCIESLVKPDWATSIDRDGVGLFVIVSDNAGDRRAYWVNPGRYPVVDRAGKLIGNMTLDQGCFQDETEYLVFQKNGFQQPNWADQIGVDDYGLYVDVSIKQVTQRFRWISPGQFFMGSPETEPERRGNETLHEVILTQGYWLADSACTQALWKAVMGENPSEFEGEQNPVEKVSWEQVKTFIKKLNRKKLGLALRLPTEAEWEYACRAGTITPFSFGENITSEQVNYNSNFPYANAEKGRYRKEIVAVQTLPANAWGLYEMHGNVWEWCQDWFGEYSIERVVDPQGPTETGVDRVLRGGGWSLNGLLARSACRHGYGIFVRLNNIGFRLARGQTSD